MIIPRNQKELVSILSDSELKDLQSGYFSYCLDIGIHPKEMKMYKREARTMILDRDFLIFSSGWISGRFSNYTGLGLQVLSESYLLFCDKFGVQWFDVKMYIRNPGSRHPEEFRDFTYFKNGWIKGRGYE